MVRGALAAAVGAALGLTNVLDPAHAVLVACLLFAALLLGAGSTEQIEDAWPHRPSSSRAGGRATVSDLSWRVLDHDRLVDAAIVCRVRELAVARLAFIGVDADDPAQWPEVERLLGPAVAADLAAERRPTARTLQRWLDTIDRLGNERTTR